MRYTRLLNIFGVRGWSGIGLYIKGMLSGWTWLLCEIRITDLRLVSLQKGES